MYGKDTMHCASLIVIKPQRKDVALHHPYFYKIKI